VKASVLIGSRGSPLALLQAGYIAKRLSQHAPHISVEIVPIRTKGDQVQDLPLADIGEKGLFVKELQKALLAGRVHLAVHSLKDLPTDMPPGLTIGAVSPREDPRDVLISSQGQTLDQLPAGARLGTSSRRRAAQLLHCRGDLPILDLRGNLDTRLRKLDQGLYEAIVVAAAGVHRLGLESRITQYLPPEVCLPSPGQGAIAVEVREEDVSTRELLTSINDPVAYRTTGAERSFLARLGGGCQVPVGAYAREEGEELTLLGMVASIDGTSLIRSSARGPRERWREIGEELAERILELGAGDILRQIWTPWRT
jgi:hydroxymethylbilane synthase